MAAVAIADRTVVRLRSNLALHVGRGLWAAGGTITASLWRLDRKGYPCEHLVFTSTDPTEHRVRIARDDDSRMLWVNGAGFEVGSDAALRQIRAFLEAHSIAFEDDSALRRATAIAPVEAHP